MATLRNKTTEAGIIVRWKPHPDHNRPSTYQVTDRAVVFLEEIGFRVPSPGDETEISWDICRPLRVLGDLHFKSETPGDVKTGHLADVDENFGHSLTDAQQARLRRYIETHPNYGSSSESLEGELSSLPETASSDGGKEETTTNSEKKTTDRATSSVLSTDDIVIGRVKRISSSGNAMLKTDSGKEYNLGSLPETIVGEVVPAAVGNGTWAFCLSSEFWNHDYLKEFSSKPGYEHTSVAELYLTDSGNGRMESPLNDHDIEIGDVVTVDITHSGTEITLGKYQETIVEVSSDIPLPAGEVTVEVVDDTKPILATEPTVSGNNLPEVGDTIEVTTGSVDDQNAYCLHNEILITIPGANISTGISLQVAVTAIQDCSVTASIAALPSADRPQRGDAVWVENGTLIEYSAIPVEVPPELDDVSDRLRLEVTNVAEDHVTVTGQSWQLLPDTSADDEVDAEIIGWHDDGTFATAEGVPIFLDGFHGNYGGNRRIKLIGLAKGCVHGEVVEPIYRVAEGSIGDYLEAMQEGHRKLGDDDLVSAGDSFSTGMGVSPDHHPVCWVDARACFAYSTIWALTRNNRFGGAHDAVAEAKEDLQSMQSNAREAVDVCLQELVIIEHAVYAVEAWSQRNQIDVALRKARATAKQEIRIAAEKSKELAETISETELNRRALHPLVILAVDDAATQLDVVHDSVSEFLDEHAASADPIGWTALTEIDQEATNDQYTLVESFDPSREPSEELSTRWNRASEDATSAEDTIVFRNAKREYRRSEAIQRYVRCRADGACEACGEDAPFEDTRGRPYLEFHHVDEFDMSGPDVPSRVVAVCPTCHTRIHTGADGMQLNEELRAKLDDGLGTLGS